MNRCGMITAGVFLSISSCLCLAQAILFFTDFCEGTLFGNTDSDDEYDYWGTSYTYYDPYEDQSYCNVIGGFGLVAAIVTCAAAVLTFIFTCCGRLDKQRAAAEEDDDDVPATIVNAHKVDHGGTKPMEDREEEEIGEG